MFRTTRETVELDLDYQAEGSQESWKFRLFDTAGLEAENGSTHLSIIFPLFVQSMQSKKWMWYFWYLMPGKG